MSKILIPFVLLLFLFVSACDEKQEPAPDDTISSMAVSARKTNDAVLLEISAATIKNGTVPMQTTFEKAEVWISEDGAGFNNMKLTYTTAEKTLKLENLKADKTYHVAVKGIKNGVTSEFSKPILFTTSSLKAGETLLELPQGWFMISSDKSPYLAYVDAGSGELILQNWKTKAKEVIFKNNAGRTYQPKGFFMGGTRLYLETTRNRERAFHYYDLIDKKFVELDSPVGSRIWNYTFSPDGSKMAYTDYNREGLYIYDFMMSIDKQYSTEFFNDFFWSVDGVSIVQVRNKPNSTSDTREVVSWDFANSKIPPVHLFDWSDTMQWMNFSPKGDYILFASYVSNNSDLWVYDVNSRKTWQISDVTSFGWLTDKDFFVNTNKTGNETNWKTLKYKMP